MKVRLYVNVDHVATLRQARRVEYPDPLDGAFLAEAAGADGITAHLREDRRHIQDYDVANLRQRIKTRLNLEMAAVEEMVKIAIHIRPHQVSLVPEKRQEITTEGGLNVRAQEDHLREIADSLKPLGIRYSLFVDPDIEQIAAARRVGADSVEINTGLYSERKAEAERLVELEKIRQAARYAAAEMGLRVFAGHGLTTENVVAIAAIPQIEELNIGFYIVARALYIGMEKSVKEMVQAIRKGHMQRK